MSAMMSWSVALACFTARQCQAAEGELLESASRYDPPKKTLLGTNEQALRGECFRLHLFHGICHGFLILLSFYRKFRLLANQIRIIIMSPERSGKPPQRKKRPASQEPGDAPPSPTKKAEEAPSPTSAKKAPKKQQAIARKLELTRKLSRQSEDAAALAKVKP